MLSGRFMAAWLAGLGILGGRSGEVWRSQAAQLASRLLRSDAVHRRFEGVNGDAAIATLSKVMRARYDPHPWDDLYFAVVSELPLCDAFWAERDVTPRLSSVRIPVYLGAEWANVPLHLPGLFDALDAPPTTTRVRATVMKRGGLSWPWESQHLEALAWYDHWLKERDTGILDGPPIRFWLAGADEWRTAERWPPPGMRQEALHLGADGRLCCPDTGCGCSSRAATWTRAWRCSASCTCPWEPPPARPSGPPRASCCR
jgi:predicted acyl esterase